MSLKLCNDSAKIGRIAKFSIAAQFNFQNLNSFSVWYRLHLFQLRLYLSTFPKIGDSRLRENALRDNAHLEKTWGYSECKGTCVVTLPNDPSVPRRSLLNLFRSGKTKR